MWVQIAFQILVACQGPKPLPDAIKEPKRVDAVVVSVGDLFDVKAKFTGMAWSLVVSDQTVLKCQGAFGGGTLWRFEAKAVGVCPLKFSAEDKTEDEVLVVVEKPTPVKKAK